MADNEPLVETVVIDGDDEPLRRKLEGMASWMQSWGKKIGAIGAGIGALGGSAQAALSKAANDLANYSAGLDKQIRQHNISAEALGAMKLQADQTGGSLDEMLKNGTRATAEFQVAAEKLGVTMSGENVAAGVALSRALGLVKEQMRFLWMNIGAAVAPAMRQMAQITSTVIAAAIKWVKENQPLIQTISKIASIAVAVGGALTGLGAAMWGIGAAVGWLVPVVTTLGGAFVTFLVSPMGMIAAGIAAGVAALLYFSGAARQMAGGFAVNVGGMLSAAKTILGQITQFFGQTYEGIKQALAGGDIGLAAEIGWNAVKMVWYKGSSELVTVLAQSMGAMSGIIATAIETIASMMANVFDTNSIAAQISQFGDSFANFETQAVNTLINIANEVDKLWFLFKIYGLAAFETLTIQFKLMQNWFQRLAIEADAMALGLAKAMDPIGWAKGNYDAQQDAMRRDYNQKTNEKNALDKQFGQASDNGIRFGQEAGLALRDRTAARNASRYTAENRLGGLSGAAGGDSINAAGKSIADAVKDSISSGAGGAGGLADSLKQGLQKATDDWRAGLGDAAKLPGMIPGGVPAAGAEAATASKVKDSVVGTFSAAAAGQLGGGVGATVQQQLVTQRQQLQTQRQMVTLLQRNGGLVAT